MLVSFRDPTTAWQGPDGRWRVIVGSKRSRRGMAILYRSKDFVHWVKSQHLLHSVENTGMWECPDFFPVSSVDKTNVKYVLMVSLDDTKHDVYTVGQYYQEKDNENKKRILIGWVNESDTVENNVRRGWSGVQTIPRNLWLDNSGKQLVQWPVEQIKNLRESQVDSTKTELQKKSLFEIRGVKASQADVEVSFELSTLEKAEVMDPSWVNPQSSLSHDPDKTTHGAFLDVDPLQEKLSLRSLIDNSIVESFGVGGKACMTARVYPNLAIDGAHLYVFNNGSENVRITSLSAWTMKRAQII
ncbi:hypothetical protein GIB67_010628 [Kingdonia uniflora]|uniref:Cell wall invertase n=1 Tax=Kingdonia uniflora TaxID=39325 RepID=A0A7J7MKV7_9MAGN|nr:hypothetical protein GIB67_010679 [Kingdonia uniflora]KAF6170648.1 hypothetical protein GIB67_010628 [Kingdonia uniflora]